MASIILKILLGSLLLFLLSVLVVNLVRPAIHKKVSDTYRQQIADTAFESDQVSDECIRCLDSNEDALLWRLRMIAAAKEQIVLSTFDLRTDENGGYICAALLDAADRGVKVRLLIDGIYEPLTLHGNDTFYALCAHENVEAKIYNPIRLSNIYDVNYRMHDKYILVDNRMYMLGGRNTDDIFLGEEHKGSNVDRDLLVYQTADGKGDSFSQLEAYFETIWTEDCTEPVKVKNEKAVYAEEQQKLREIYADLVKTYGDFSQFDAWTDDTYPANQITLISNGTAAGNKEPRILYTIEQLAKGADNIAIQTPYIICSKSMYGTLTRMAKDSNVSIYLNAVARGSNPWGCTDYLNNKKKVLGTGSAVYEVMNEYAIHTKAVLIDDNLSVIGSCNMDMRSIYLDTELMLVIDSPELNAHIRSTLADYAEKSIYVSPDGTETVGAAYTDRILPRKKKILYGILRVVTIPFRHLL